MRLESGHWLRRGKDDGDAREILKWSYRL
jgi:hypothetical protein